jgi:hypothetical protein
MNDDDRLFAADQRLQGGANRVDLGRLHVPTGCLYCCDPFLSSDCGVLDRVVPAGELPVRLDLVPAGQWGERVGFAALEITRRPVASWANATYRRNGKVFDRFFVDAGLACFMDAEAERLFRAVVGKFYHDHPDGNYYNDVLASGFSRSARFPGHSGDWLMHLPADGIPLNVAMFASGLGDGTYPHHWGLDTSDAPCRLIVDFGISE